MAHLERFVAFSMLCEESCKSLQRIKAAYMNKLGLQSGAALLRIYFNIHFSFHPFSQKSFVLILYGSFMNFHNESFVFFVNISTLCV